MKWYRPLYLGEKAKAAKLKTMKKVKEKRVQRDTYFITLPSNPANLLDIISANQLLWPYYRRRRVRKKIWVIGIAKGKEEAFELVRTIVDEVYQKTGGFDIREYLKFGLKRE